MTNKQMSVREKLSNTKVLTGLAMFAALAYAVMVVGRIPIVLFLKYDPKDFVLVIASFIYGVVPASIITIIVAIIETFTVSDTGFWGLLMNIVASLAFLIPASYFFHKSKTVKNVVVGLIFSTIIMTIIMLIWNWVVTPLYLEVPRSEIVKLLIPAILPFNLIKGFANSAIVALLYKRVLSIKSSLFNVEYDLNTDTLKNSILAGIGLVLLALILYFII